MKRILTVIFLAVRPAVSQAQCDGWGWGHMTGGWGGFMMIFWLIVFILIGYGLYALGRNKGGGTSGQAGGKALDILKERYAKGEISREEYERMKKDIER